MLSKRLVEQGRIKMLDCDRQPLERPFLAVTRHFTYLMDLYTDAS